MKIMALDQAVQKTGVAIFEDSTLTHCSAFDYHKEKDAGKRLMLMALRIYGGLKETKPDVVIMEDVSFQKNAASLILLSRLQGAILGWCFAHDIECVIYKAAAWRKMLGFKQGRLVKRPDLKLQAKEFVNKWYGLDATEDEADAICIGCAYACANGLINFEGDAQESPEAEEELHESEADEIHFGGNK